MTGNRPPSAIDETSALYSALSLCVESWDFVLLAKEIRGQK
jgi:hypothetical protein